MTKTLLTLALTGLAFSSAVAQRVYPLRTAEQIQTVPAARLANCDDAPNFLGDTVRIQGVVLNRGGIAQSGNGRQIWIRDLAGDGLYRNIGVRYGRGGTAPGTPTSPVDILTLQAGDTVELTGTVEEFNTSATSKDSETQINPLPTGVDLIGSGGPAPAAALVNSIGLLNNSSRQNNLTTGEAYEGNFIEIQNVTVVEVAPFSNGARVSFTVADAQGNRIEVSDRFLAQRLPTGNPPGNFTAPAVGDQFTSIKGIIIHNKNNCPNTGASNRGYTLNPFDASHYVRGASAPTISGVNRTVISPCSTDAVTVNTTIVDNDGTVAEAKLFFSIGESNTTYSSVPMVATGSSYTASIPAQAEGTMVKYYVSATDNDGRITKAPNVSATVNPIFYFVRCGAPQIRDVQYTPYTNGNSGYTGLTVTNVEGIVTSTANAQNDLGQIYIQQEGSSQWGGIWLIGSSLANFNRGDKIRVTGDVKESNGMTQIAVASSSLINSNNVVTPVPVSANTLTSYSFATSEPLEGMLVTVTAPAGNLFVVDTNVLASGSAPGSNFGEYRLGGDQFNPSEGVTVLTGRLSSTVFSSKAVSYVNNISRSILAANGGPLAVPAIRVNLSDRFSSVTGQVYYGFSAIKLLPRNNNDMPFITQAARKIKKGDIIVYPNPTVDSKIKIKRKVYQKSESSEDGLTDLEANETCHCNWHGVPYTLYTLYGNPTGISGELTGGEVELDLLGLAPGVYNLVLDYPDGAVTEQVIVL